MSSMGRVELLDIAVAYVCMAFYESCGILDISNFDLWHLKLLLRI
jgi:hypothetical protein